MFIKYNRFEKNKKWEHPYFSNNINYCETKIYNEESGEYIIKTFVNVDYSNLDSRFKIKELTKEEVNSLLQEWGMTERFNEDDEIILNDKKIWKNKISFEKEFTIDELVKIKNYEYFIDKNISITEDEKQLQKMYMKVIMEAYNNVFLNGGEIWNTDTTLISMLNFLVQIEFISESRMVEIIGGD